MRGDDLSRYEHFVPHWDTSLTRSFPNEFGHAWKSGERVTCFYMDKPAPFGRLRRFAACCVSLTIAYVLAELIGRQKVERMQRKNMRSQEQSPRVLRSFPYLTNLRLV